MAEDYTDKEHQVTHKSGSTPHSVTLSTQLVGKIAVVVVLCILSFVGGTAYQKHHGDTTTKTAAGGQGFGQGGFGGRRSGGIGAVTAISSTSITVQDQRSNSTKTYSISSSTQITDNGSTVDYTDIKTGDTVLVSTSSATSTTATRILVNPSFGGGGPGGQDNASSSGSSAQSD